MKLKSKSLLILVALFFILSLVYAWATPPLEASDELWHFGMVNHIADTGELPVQQPGQKSAWEQEGSQPPLYYLLSAVLVVGIDRSDFTSFADPNPHVVAGIPGAVGNKNLILHDAQYPPLQGTALAVMLLRLFSILLGCVTVGVVYSCARELQPERPSVALVAAALTAFNPMFLFISASVNNDNLVTMLNSLILWQLLVMLRVGFSTRRMLLLAVLLALTALSKLSGLVLMPVVVLAVLYVVLNGRSLSVANVGAQFSKLIVPFLLILVAFVLLAGWWYLRNLSLYGELFGTKTMVAVAGPREGGFDLATLLAEFQGFRFAYWALFGAFNIMTFRWFYDVMDVLTLAALVGLAVHLWRNRTNTAYLIRISLLMLAIIGGCIGVIGWTALTYASQGRLLFPFIAAISPLLALGLVQLTDWLSNRIWLVKRFSRFALALPFIFAAFALIVPFVSIAPNYAPPALLSTLPASAHQVYARFDSLELIGYETPNQRYFPGDSVPITVYWKVLQQIDTDLSLFLHATLDDGSVIGKVDSYPGAGRLRTTTWEPEAIYSDTYAIPLDTSADLQSRLRVRVGWWDYPTEQGVDAVDQQGNPLQAVMLDVGGFAPLRTSVALPANFTLTDSVRFGDRIELSGYHLQDNDLKLAWKALATLPSAYTVFVQVLDSQNNVVGQGDAPPVLPTNYWQPGEGFITQHHMVYTTSPSTGEYRLLIGWYNSVDFSRLAIDQPDNAYLLMNLTLP